MDGNGIVSSFTDIRFENKNNKNETSHIDSTCMICLSVSLSEFTVLYNIIICALYICHIVNMSRYFPKDALSVLAHFFSFTTINYHVLSSFFWSTCSNLPTSYIDWNRPLLVKWTIQYQHPWDSKAQKANKNIGEFTKATKERNLFRLFLDMIGWLVSPTNKKNARKIKKNI